MTHPVIKDLSTIKNSLVDRFLVTSFLVAVLALAGSLYRIQEVGFQPVMAVHIMVSAVFGTVTIFRHRFTHRVKSFIVVILLFLAGTVGIMTFGLIGAGTFVLLSAVIVARLFLSIRVALSVAAVSTLLMSFYLHLASIGGLSFPGPTPDYELSVSAWANNITSFVFVSMVVLYVIDHFFNHLIKLSMRLEEEVELGHEQLENSELLLSTILNTLTYGVMWKDLNLNFIGCNRLFASDAGLNSVREVSGKTDFDFTDVVTAERYRVQDQEVINSGKPLLNIIERYDQGDGEKYLIINRVPLNNREGKTIGVLVSYADITETKQLEIALRDAKSSAELASKAKSEFLATMSHEIRTPINGVMGLLELTLDTELTEKQREFLTKAELSANTLLHIINHILDISKIEAGKMEFENVPFVLPDVLQQVQHQLGHMAEQKGLKFEITGRGKVEQHIVGDPTKLLQILINLCSNAIKFTELGGVKLTVGALPQNEVINVRIVIEDTGIGISQEKLDRLFESFTQADSSMTRRFGGTGLGLTIVKQLVELQGGKIKVESKQGQGTKITCFLQYPTSEGGQEIAAKHKHTSLENVRVLVVEDNKINQLIAKEMLEMEGAIVYLAEDGLEALESLSKDEVDIVLMDIQMPRMDGIAAIQEVRKQPQWHTLPIVAVTANVLSHEVESYRQIGFNRHLGKPFQREQLVRVIHELLPKQNYEPSSNALSLDPESKD